jgi:hypothetical protein
MGIKEVNAGLICSNCTIAISDDNTLSSEPEGSILDIEKNAVSFGISHTTFWEDGKDGCIDKKSRVTMTLATAKIMHTALAEFLKNKGECYGN